MEKRKITLYLGDAVTMPTALDHYNWLFLFNSFAYELAKQVFSNIFSSVIRNKRKVRIVYAEPSCHRLLTDSGLFSLVRQIQENDGRLTYYTHVYESLDV